MGSAAGQLPPCGSRADDPQGRRLRTAAVEQARAVAITPAERPPLPASSHSASHDMQRRLASTLALLLACHASSALASYAQMTLPGLAADLQYLLIAAYAIVVDIILLCLGFRRRWI